MRRAGYLDLIRGNSDFRWLWLGQIVSLLGDWFNLIASVALIASLTESGLAVGGLFVLRMLAPFLTSPLAGVVADRVSRRRILIAADVARGLVVLGMLWVRSAEWIWLFYLLTALQLGTSSFFFTARNAILPDIVAPRALGAANAISSATWSTMLAVGAALGGFAAGWLGVYAAFAIDAATFFVSAILVARIRPDVTSEDDGGGRLSAAAALGKYRESLGYLAKHSDILALTLHKTALTLLVGTTLRVVQAFAAEREFPVGEQGGTALGLMFAAAGVGTAIGPLVTRYFTGDAERRLRWAIVGGYLLGCLGLLVSARVSSLEEMLIGALLAGVGNGILWVFSTQLLLQLVDPVVRGRVLGTEFAMFTLASALGSAVIGVAVDSPLGISGVLLCMATLSLLPAIAWTLWLLARRRRLDGTADGVRPDNPSFTDPAADREGTTMVRAPDPGHPGRREPGKPREVSDPARFEKPSLRGATR